MEQLLYLAHSLDKFVVGMEGNVSCKNDDGLSFLIKASGTELKSLSYSELIKCDIDGKKLHDNRNPSIEVSFHALIYKLNPDIRFIAHTHPTNTVSILCSDYMDHFANARLFPDQVVFNGSKSCVIPYTMPGIKLCAQIGYSLNNFINMYKVFPKLILLENHGIICAGQSIAECLIATEICEKSAEIFLKSKTLGKLNTLRISDINEIENDQNEKYRKSLLNK